MGRVIALGTEAYARSPGGPVVQQWVARRPATLSSPPRPWPQPFQGSGRGLPEPQGSLARSATLGFEAQSLWDFHSAKRVACKTVVGDGGSVKMPPQTHVLHKKTRALPCAG